MGDHGAPEVGKLPGPEVVEKKEIAKERAAHSDVAELSRTR